MAWSYDEPFKLRHREGRCIEAAFIENKTRWISLKTNDIETARKIAWKMCVDKGSGAIDRKNVTFRQFASDFFMPDSQYTKKRIAFDKSITANPKKQAYVEHYMLPKFGDMRLCEIKPSDIEDWYSTLMDFRNGNPLSSATKMFVLSAMGEILREAVKREYIRESPINYVDRIRIEYSKRDKISAEDMRILFPENPDAMIALYGDSVTALYFSILKDTGFRPGEALGLKWKNINIEKKAIYTTASFITSGMKYREKIKTTAKGKSYKVGLISDMTMELLEMHPCLTCHSDDDFVISRTIEGSGKIAVISYSTLNFRLHQILKYLGMDGKYTMYSLRHTFQSDMETKIDDSILLELMGHTKRRTEYSHHTSDEIIDMVSKVRDSIVSR